MTFKKHCSHQHTPDDYHKLASRFGFEWFGPVVTIITAKTLWKCKNGHIMRRSYESVSRSGGTCNQCSKDKIKVKPLDYHALAKARGFEWSGIYPQNSKKETVFHCKCGHVFVSTYQRILFGKKCPYCGPHARKLPGSYVRLAESRGIEWVGEFPCNAGIKTAWKCKQGHIWFSTYHTIDQGKGGCPHCKKNSPDDYHALAKRRGFKWVGDYPEASKHKTKWQCQHGHIWSASYNNLLNGNGCYVCYNKSPLTAQDYLNLARERNFLWLGKRAVRSDTPTLWQCPLGHKWKAHYGNIHKGSGCPVCHASRGEQKIAKFLQGFGIPFTREKHFKACRDKSSLPFDFYFRLNNALFLIEYDGIQHFETIDQFGGDEGFRDTQKRDKIKNIFAQKHGFILIRIPYWEFDNIENVLRENIELHIGKKLEPILQPSLNKFSLPKIINYIQLPLFDR